MTVFESWFSPNTKGSGGWVQAVKFGGKNPLLDELSHWSRVVLSTAGSGQKRGAMSHGLGVVFI